jgi:MoaA/NifB/PqqE/SkfB family radical SAM enzyme
LKKDVDKMPEFIEHRKLLMGEPIAPIRSFNPEPYQKSGNMKLPTVPCGYCEHKHQCHPGLRTFLAYGNKPVYLTTVKREPKMVEVTDA